MFANSSHSVSAMDAKLRLITGRQMGSVIRGRRKTIRYSRKECRTDSHFYGNRRHVFRAFTDGECEILDTCVKKGSSMPKRRRSRSLACKATYGDHCAQISYRKIACAVVSPSQTARQLASATYSRDDVICIWPSAI